MNGVMRKAGRPAISLVLLLPVTSSVIAENTHQRQTTILNLPPQVIDFDLSDLIDADQKHPALNKEPLMVGVPFNRNLNRNFLTCTETIIPFQL
jgi:hypothetical protein